MVDAGGRLRDELELQAWESAMVKLTRREVVASTLAAPALVYGRNANAAAGFPNKNIQFVIPYAPGGGFDVYVRFVGPVVEKYLPNKANIVPINVAAGGGSRGVAQLYRSRPDGYTVGILNIPGMFILQQQQGPSVTGPEGTAYAATLIGAQLLGLKTQLITGYKGSVDYVVAAIRGDSDAVIAAIPTTMRFVRGGQVRVLASFEAHSSIPGVPDATALGQPELDNIAVERLIAAPPGVPPEIQNTLSMTLAKALADPAVVAWAKQSDIVMRSRTPQEAVAILNQQRAFFEKWKKYLVTG